MDHDVIASLMLAAALAAPAAAASPSFEPPTGLDIAGSASTVAVGDFDGDGRTDLAAGYGLGPGAVSVWLGTGNPASAFAHQSPDVAVGMGPVALVARDLNGDGRDDLAVANGGPVGDDGDDDVTILLGSPSGLVSGETLRVRDAPLAIDSDDLDGDGDLDLVVANSGLGTISEPSVHVSVPTGNGSGHFEVAHHAGDCRRAGVAIADLVAGGGLEIGVACATVDVARIYAPDAGGALHQVGSDHAACDDNPVDLAAGNFDGLGTSDLAVVCLRSWFTVLGSDRGYAPAQGGGGVRAPDTTRPRLALSAPRTIQRAKLLRNGVRLTVVPDEPSLLAFQLVGSTRTVRLARVGDVVLAERRLPLTSARRSVTLRLPQRFRSRLSRRFSLTIRVTATDTAGNRTVTTRKLRVR